MPTYQVINKQHVRATIVDEHMPDAHGTTYVVRHAGTPIVYAVGDRITDLTPAELEAFPDRFVLVEAEGLTPDRSPGQAPGTPAPPAPRLHPDLFALMRQPKIAQYRYLYTPRLHPDLFALMRRACAGQATPDEQAVVEALVPYLASQAAGQATPDAAAALDVLLKDVGLTLFVEGA